MCIDKSAKASTLPDPDQAWKALSITNEWVRHADTKVGVTLAFVGATGTMLYNLVKSLQDWGWLLGGAAIICTIALFVATAAGFMALFPRTTPHTPQRNFTGTKEAGAPEDENSPADEEAVNLLFYGDIAHKYSDNRPTFVDVFRILTNDKNRMTGHIAHQIHVNAHIATTKFRWTNRAIKAEVAAVGALALVAFLVGKS